MLTVLPFVAGRIANGDELYMYNFIYHFIDMDVLTPAAILTLLTGLVYSLFTQWGFIKHGWIIYKWLVTLAIIITGTFYLGPMVANLLEISNLQRIAALNDQYYKHGVTVGLWAGAINTTLLVIAVFLSIYGFPAWVEGVWAIAVWGALVGSVLLLMAKRMTEWLFLTALVAMVLTSIHNFGLSNGLEVMGDPFSLAFTAVIFVISVALYFYARDMVKLGVLR